MDGAKEREEEGTEDDEKWMVTINRLLTEFEGQMDLTEIREKLADSRYCSEFDVLNDILQQEHGNAQHIKARFCSYFGNLVDWGYKRLISWCKPTNSTICARRF